MSLGSFGVGLPVGSSKGVKGKGRERVPAPMGDGQTNDSTSDAERLVQLWTAEDAAAAIQSSGRTVMALTRMLQAIHDEMAQLCQKTRGSNGVGLQLTIQRRTSGAVSLRWKTSNQCTLSVEALAQRLSGLPPDAQRWYAELDQQARWTNTKERLVRHARQVMRDLYA